MINGAAQMVIAADGGQAGIGRQLAFFFFVFEHKSRPIPHPPLACLHHEEKERCKHRLNSQPACMCVKQPLLYPQQLQEMF